jgi:putative exosortase-associated protein (TIGR04073 family)
MALASVAGADSYKNIENSTPQEVVDGMMTKAGRGLANVTTGWLELPKQVYTTSKENGVTEGVFIGPLKGLGMTLVRTASGIVEFMTFFVSYPGFYDPFFTPAYVWQKE